MSVEVVQDEGRPRLPLPDAGLALLVSLAVALLITIGEVDHLLSQVLDGGRTWSVTKLTGTTAVLHPGETMDGWDFFAVRAQGANMQVDGWLRMYAATDIVLAATYALLGLAWFRRFRSRLGRVGVALVLAGAGADFVENVLIGLGAPLGWLLLAATAVKWLALLPAAVLALWTLRATLARLPKAFYTHRYSALIVLPLALLSLGRGPDLLEQIPDIQRTWADPGQHWDFVWAGLVMGALVVATLFIGRQRTGHLWLRTCPRWTGDEHPCPEGECPVHARREHEHPPKPLIRLWFIGPVLLVLAAAGLGLAGADIGMIRLAAFCALPLAVGGLSLWLRRRWDDPDDARQRPDRPADRHPAVPHHRPGRGRAGRAAARGRRAGRDPRVRRTDRAGRGDAVDRRAPSWPAGSSCSRPGRRSPGRTTRSSSGAATSRPTSPPTARSSGCWCSSRPACR